MRTKEELRLLARELSALGVQTPYFMQVNGYEIKELSGLPGYVPAGRELLDRTGACNIGSWEHFQFFARDRRKGKWSRREASAEKAVTERKNMPNGKEGLRLCIECKHCRTSETRRGMTGHTVAIPPSCGKLYDIVTGDMPNCLQARLGADHLLLRGGPLPRADYDSFVMREENRCGIEAKWFEAREV